MFDASTFEAGRDDAIGGSSVPKGGPSPEFGRTSQNSIDLGFERLQLHEAVAPLMNGHRPFGIVAQRKTRNSKIGRFFLYAARIGEDEPRL